MHLVELAVSFNVITGTGIMGSTLKRKIRQEKHLKFCKSRQFQDAVRARDLVYQENRLEEITG